MTLEEYEKVREEKRKNLLALKPEARKVNVDKAFESMQQLSNKKEIDKIFIKLVSSLITVLSLFKLEQLIERKHSLFSGF
uniref:Uncharacterized protein n=1 Tax=Rhizophora mucronata TaxID=61149 RepID=A0A2P2L2P8_RHIMU